MTRTLAVGNLSIPKTPKVIQIAPLGIVRKLDVQGRTPYRWIRIEETRDNIGEYMYWVISGIRSTGIDCN